MMQEAVEYGQRQCGVIVKYFRPVFEGFVGGACFISFADNLKEQLGPGMVNGQIAQLIQDQKFGFAVFFQLLFQAAYPRPTPPRKITLAFCSMSLR